MMEQERLRAELAERKARDEASRAEQERAKAEQERIAKERLAAKLLEMGIDPDEFLKSSG
jgi:Fe2+ transport system protein FeoA